MGKKIKETGPWEKFKREPDQPDQSGPWSKFANNQGQNQEQTPESQFEEREKNLITAYGIKFQREYEPTLSKYQQQFKSELEAKQLELVTKYGLDKLDDAIVSKINAEFEPKLREKEELLKSETLKDFNQLQKLVQDGLMPADQAQQEYEKRTQDKAAAINAQVESEFDEFQKPYIESYQKEKSSALNSEIDQWSKSRQAEINRQIEDDQKKLLPDFLARNKKDIDKWSSIYQKDFLEKDFSKNKISNPIKSAWTSASAALTKDLPSAAYGTKALSMSAMNKLDKKIDDAVKEIPVSDKLKESVSAKIESTIRSIWGDEAVDKSTSLGKTKDEIAKELVIKDLRKAIDFSDASEDQKKYLINSLDKVKDGDFVDYLNYTAAAVGQGLGQIPASIGTRGTTSIVQEMGSIYLDSLRKIAEEESIRTGKEVTWEQVIKDGKDDVLWPVLTGLAAGLLDAYGANKLNPFNKKEVLDSFRKRALALAETVGTETVTEGTQGALENIGVSKATGKTWAQTFAEFNWKTVTESALQGGIASIFLGGGGQALQSAASASANMLKSKSTQLKPEAPKISLPNVQLRETGTVSPQTTGEPIQPDAAGQIQPGGAPAIQQGSDATGQTPATDTAPVLSENPVTNFTTEKGSTYVVDGQSTTRTKAKRDGQDDFGLKEPSMATVYLSEDDAAKAQVIYTSGVKSRQINKVGDQVVIKDELDNGQIKETSFPFSNTPEKGLYPFEVFKDGNAHLGNKIVSVNQSSNEVQTKQTEAEAQEVTAPVAEKPSVEVETKNPKPQRETKASGKAAGGIPQNAMDIAAQYDNEVRNPSNLNEAERAIANVLQNTKVTGKSVNRFGDKNALNKSLAKSYIRKSGQGIDVIAAQVSESIGQEVTPEDVWSFMQRFPNGARTAFTPSGNPRLFELSNQYATITGKAINRRTARSIAKRVPQNTGKLPEANQVTLASKLEEFTDQNGNFDAQGALDWLDSTDDAATAFGISEEELRQLKNSLYEDTKQGNVQPQGTAVDRPSIAEDSPDTAGERPEGGEQQAGIAASVGRKIRSYRNAETEAERQQIGQEILAEAGRYILNREGLIVGDDASFADRTSATFFDLLDENKSVYLLSPDAKIAETEADYRQIEAIASFLDSDLKLNLVDGKLVFDEAFQQQVMFYARQGGFDAVRLMEIDGTNSTLQILNFDKLEHVSGEDFVASRVKKFEVQSKKDVENVAQQAFALTPEESAEVARVYDAIISQMAKRAGRTKEEQYKTIKFTRGNRKLADILNSSDGLKYQLSLWHSSPYLFDRFQMSKIGQGVGKQKLGWGLYFLGKEGPTKGYATLPFVTKILPGFYGKFIAGEIDVARQLAEKYSGDFDLYRKDLEKQSRQIFGGRKAKSQVKVLADLESAINERGLGKFTYKVTAHGNRTPDQYDYLSGSEPITEQQAKKIAAKGQEIKPGTRGEEVYNRLVTALGSPQAASRFLLEAGIDGMIYTDDSLYRGGDKTDNKVYVVFDENAVSIESVLKFQKEAELAKGAMQQMANGQAMIYALTDPDVSTPLHEIAHVYESYLTPQERQTVLKWSGQSEWNIETSENFARGFETYLREGKAPTPALQRIFDQFKKWLTAIYKALAPGKELNSEMRAIYDQMIADLDAQQDVQTEPQAQPQAEPKTEPQTPEPPPVEPPAAEPPSRQPNMPEKPEGSKERMVAKRYMADPDVSDEVKSGLSQDGRYYIPTTDLKRQAEADAYIEEKGIDQAIADITNPDNGLSDQNRIFIGKTVYRMLKDEVKSSPNPNAVRDKINRVIEDIAKLGTRAGQTVQAFANMFTSDAEQVAYAIQKEYDRSRSKALDYNEPQVQSLKQLIDQATDEALRDLLNDPRIKALIDEERRAEPEFVKKRKKFVAKVLSKLDQLEKEIDDNIKSGRLNADISFGLLPIAYKAAINTIRVAVKAGDSLADAIEKVISEINSDRKRWQDGKRWDEAAFRKLFESEIKEEGKRNRKTLLQALSESGDTFKSLAQDHYKNYAGRKKEIKTILREELNLSEEDADRLGRALDKIVAEKRQRIIESKFGGKLKTPKTKRVAKQLADKIQEFTNLGVMSDKNMREAYLESIGLPSLTDEQAAEMERLVAIAESKPVGFARYEAIQDLIKYHQSVTPVDWRDVLESIWYANMLSGLSTQSLNFQANSVNVMAETLVAVPQSLVEYRNPRVALANFAFMLRGLADGWRMSVADSANVLKNGYQGLKGQKFDESSFRGVKTSKASVLEILSPKNPLSYWKYVGRLMAAADMLFYGSLKQMRAHQIAFRNAFSQNQNTYSPELLKNARQIIGTTDRVLAAAKLRAESEGFTGRNLNRRVYEIMEQSWAPEMREDANSFASRGTYNYEPDGVLGVLTGVINNATSKVPILKTVVPFSRIISNVLNQYLDYTPWGLVRVAKGGMGIPNGMGFRRYSQEEMLRAKIKGVTGTMALITLYALTQGDEDDEPFLEITADGTGNLKKNYELGETGWAPYSFKIKGTGVWISYQNTPLGIVFAIIGHIRDAENYKAKDVNDEKIGMIFSGAMHYITDMSFLSGLSDFFEILSDTNTKNAAEKLVGFANRTAKTAIVPNIVTQVSRGVQEVIDSPMKRGDGFFGQYYRDIPVLRDNLNTMYNALGEPIVTETLYKFNPILSRFTLEADDKSKDSAKLWELIIENKAWIGAPSKSTMFYDPQLGYARTLDDQEYYEYALKSGRYTKEMLLNYYDSLASETDPEVVRKRIEDIKTQARERAKGEMFDLLNQ